MKSIKAWFPTLIYSERLQARGLQAFNFELLDECRRIREYDEAGRRWSEANYPLGYTSYGSLDRLHRFSSTFDQLRERIDGHVTGYARAQDWDLQGGQLEMTDCWINVMPRGCAHSFHVHPQSVVSGTYDVATPRGPDRSIRPRPDQSSLTELCRAGAIAARRAEILEDPRRGSGERRDPLRHR